MGTFNTIILILGAIPIIVILLTIISSSQSVRSLIDRFFVILLCLPEILRNGCAYIINHVRAFLATSIRSVGFGGEHGIQRIIGAILLTFCTTVAIIVSILILMVTLEAIFNSGNVSLINMLPISLEALIAIELVAAVVLFGMLLLDVLGVTHLTKFYSTDNLPRYLRYIFGTIFVIGALFSIYILSAGGYIRYDSLISEVSDMSINSTYTPLGNNVYIPNQTFNNVKIEEKHVIPSDSSGTSQAYKTSLKSMMIGIPISSAVSGLFGAVGLIPFGGVLISGLSFLIAILILGPFWIIGHALMILVNHIYNFVFSLLDIFIQFGDSIKGRFSGQATENPQSNIQQPPSQAPSNNENNNEQQPDNSAPSDPEEQNENSMYGKNDPNWNPLL